MMKTLGVFAMQYWLKAEQYMDSMPELFVGMKLKEKEKGRNRDYPKYMMDKVDAAEEELKELKQEVKTLNTKLINQRRGRINMAEQIGENIRRVRHQRGLTQAELGSMVGIPDSTIRKYELGIVNPRSKRLETIADALEVNVETLKNTKIDEMAAIHRLFQLFCQYDGVFDQTEGIHFKKLDLKAWHERWILYQSDLKEAEKIVDEKKRKRAVKEVEGSFAQWMDAFH